MENEMEIKQQYNQTEMKKEVRHKNKIAGKFRLIATIIKIFGYGGAILSALIIILMSAEMLAYGIIIGLVVALILSLITWFACLSWEAKAETIQLLEDIKNKC